MQQGLADLRAGLETDHALLLALARTRLRWNGVDVPDCPWDDADMRLYLRLAERYGNDAHSRYNALVRRLGSFQHAVEAQRGRALRMKADG